METKKPLFGIKQPKPVNTNDDNSNKKSDAKPISDDKNVRRSLGPDLLWEEIK